jgi:hypothetical protein
MVFASIGIVFSQGKLNWASALSPIFSLGLLQTERVILHSLSHVAVRNSEITVDPLCH